MDLPASADDVMCGIPIGIGLVDLLPASSGYRGSYETGYIDGHVEQITIEKLEDFHWSLGRGFRIHDR